MKVSAILIFAAVALLGKCAKLPKESKNSGKAATKVVSKVTEVKAITTKQDAVKTTKQNKAAPGKIVAPKSTKADTNKVGHSTTKHSGAKNKTSTKTLAQKITGKIGKVTAKKTDKKNSLWSPKSVIVPQGDTAGVQDAIVNSHIARNPILDSLYEQRYEALEKVSAINDQINTLMSRKPVDGASESSFLRPGAFDSGTYRVQGGTMFLGPANAGDIVGMEDAKKRDESSLGRQKNGAIPDASSTNDSTAPVDMPQPMDNQFFSPEANAIDEQQNLTGKNDMDVLAAMDDPLG